MNERRFFAELKRRHVYKVAVAYAVVAWLLTQIAAISFSAFEAPRWVMKVFITAILLGFPIALILAWAFELTPEGIKRVEDVAPDESSARRSGRKFVAITIVLAVIAVSLFAFRTWRARSAATPVAVKPEVVAANTKPILEKSIAVLPFENLSDAKENAFFTEGIQDEILTKIAGIAELKVISRTSTTRYQSKPEDLKTVSQQLGVATVLEGSVQRANNKVHVNVQLIDARDDRHLWANSYDRELKDVFEVESEIAQAIANALLARLSPVEINGLTTAPTRDPEAYDLFLKGEYAQNEADNLLKAEPFDRAASFYQQALDRDPNFALAAARLAVSRVRRHWFIAQLSPAELSQVKDVADRALALAPNLAEAHIALGSFYYYGKRQYEDALAALQRAVQLQPNNVTALEWLAYIYRRQGKWDRALLEMAKCEARDPRNPQLVANIGGAYCSLRMWEEAKRAGSRALAIDPHSYLGLQTVMMASLNGTGDIDGARRMLANYPPGARLADFTVLGSAPPPVYLKVIERDFAAALKPSESEIADPDENRARLAMRAAIHVLAGNTDAAHDEIARVRDLLESRLRERPNDVSALLQLSWVNVALNRSAEALRLAHQATELVSVEKDALLGPTYLACLAEIQARTGDASQAVKTLQRLLSIPIGYYISIQQLKIDPVWDPIRNDIGFQQLLVAKEQIGPAK